MTHTDTSDRKQSRLSKGLGMFLVVALLSSSQAPAAEAFSKAKRDWSTVQAVAPGTQTTVLLHRDLAPRGQRKIKGWFHSATAESITVMLRYGQPHTVHKDDVRRVLVYRPVGDRYQVGLAAGIGTALFAPGLIFPPAFFFALGAYVLPATGVAFLVAPKMGGIYNAPRKYQSRQKGAAGSAPNRRY